MLKPLLTLLIALFVFPSLADAKPRKRHHRRHHHRHVKHVVPQAKPASTPGPTCAVKQELPGWSNFRGIAEDPTNPGDVYALAWATGGSFGRIYRSAIVRGTKGPDGKIAWSKEPIELPPSTAQDMDAPRQLKIAPDGSIWAATSRGLFMSEGKGAPFEPIARFAGMDLKALELAPAGEDYRVLVGTSDFVRPGTNPPAEAAEVYALDDVSDTEGWVSTGFKQHILDEKARLKDDTADAKDPEGSRPMRGEVNGGHSISKLISSIQADPTDPSILWVGTGNHLHRFTPAKKWEGLYSGVLNDSQVYGVAFHGKTMHMATCNGLYEAPATHDGPVTWRKTVVDGRANIANTGVLASNPDDPRVVVAVNDPLGAGLGPKGVLVSSDGGSSWKKVPGTETIRGDHLGGVVDFQPDGSFLLTGDNLTRVSPLKPTQACGPDGPVESGGGGTVASSGAGAT